MERGRSLVMADDRFDSVLDENRKFSPPATFTENAHIKSLHDYERLYRRSLEDPEGFWGEVAEQLQWFKKWGRVLDESDAPVYKWFTGGNLPHVRTTPPGSPGLLECAEETGCG
jgi:acetyl-CoA synthetase